MASGPAWTLRGRQQGFPRGMLLSPLPSSCHGPATPLSSGHPLQPPKRSTSASSRDAAQCTCTSVVKKHRGLVQARDSSNSPSAVWPSGAVSTSRPSSTSIEYTNTYTEGDEDNMNKEGYKSLENTHVHTSGTLRLTLWRQPGTH